VSARHDRSILFAGIGPEGQKRIEASAIAFVGVGAVGAAAAEIAARAGVGRLTLIDRDVVEESNLSRQFLFDAEDAKAATPKATAAARRLARIAPGVAVRALAEDLDHVNALRHLQGHDVVFDGTDNFETRLLVSDASRALGLPSIAAACVGSEGLVLVSRPPKTPCLRCFLEVLPPAGSGPTCDTVGVVPSLPPLVAAAGMTEALRIAAGAETSPGVLTWEVWNGALTARRRFEATRPSPACPACGEGRYPALEGEGSSSAVRLCGRDAVQIRPRDPSPPDFDSLARRLASVAPVRRGDGVLIASVDGVTLTLFEDGRCLIRGTGDTIRARAIYDQYVGR
jgi:adenylyltransferase/sulfurtransferase